MHAFAIHISGLGLVWAGLALLGAGIAGWTLYWRRHRHWRVRGFQHLIALSEVRDGFTFSDVVVAFAPDPHCATERRRLFTLWRRVRDGSAQQLDPPDIFDRAS